MFHAPVLGDLAGASTTTIKAELRRLMSENVRTVPGKFETRAFMVNIRTPRIATGGEVRLKDREKTAELAAWDDKLNLEFSGARPCVCALEITRADDALTLYLLGDYPEAVRQAAKEESVALIDLNAMSKVFYEALGPENSKKAFVDNTHHNNHGSYQLAKCIVEGVKANKLGIARFLVDEARQTFDPAHPDPLESFSVPASPMDTSGIPDGNTADRDSWMRNRHRI